VLDYIAILRYSKIMQTEICYNSTLNKASECLKTLAHHQRLEILFLLSKGEYSVGALAEACNIKSSIASEHLRLMQRCGLLSSKRDRNSVFYRISEPLVFELLKCIEKKFLKGVK